MEVLWVIENVKRSEDFYTKQFTLLLAASVCLWKRYHPNHKTVLYADDLTKDYYKGTPLLNLFDEIKPLKFYLHITNYQIIGILKKILNIVKN